MEELSAGPLVPAVVKPEASRAAAAADTGASAAASGDTFPASTSEPDKDFLCPICMQIIKDAFLTACGHSFCYMCIITHLRNKNDCPCCGHYLTNTNLFPNFLLDKVRFLFIIFSIQYTSVSLCNVRFHLRVSVKWRIV